MINAYRYLHQKYSQFLMILFQIRLIFKKSFNYQNSKTLRTMCLLSCFDNIIAFSEQITNDNERLKIDKNCSYGYRKNVHSYPKNVLKL